MKHWTCGSGALNLNIKLDDARGGSHSGPCDADIAALRQVPYIAAQLDAWPADIVRAELREYGAWDDAELSDHDSNLDRMLWLACGDVRDDS